MKTALYKLGYAQGYNTRDNPREIHPDSCQAMVNVFPAPTVRPRHGITPYSGLEELGFSSDDVVLFEDDDGVHVFARVGAVWSHRLEGSALDAVSILGSFTFPSESIKWRRVQESIYIVVDDSSQPLWILEKSALTDTWQIRRGWLSRPTLTLSVYDGTVDGALTEGKFIGYAATLIRRTDDAGHSSGDAVLVESDSGTFHPGDLESIELVAQRYVATVPTSGAAGQKLRMKVAGTGFDGQATHIRLYRTLEADTAAEAQGLSLRWDADMPIAGPNTTYSAGATGYLYWSNKTDDTMAGVLQLAKTTGYSTIPPPADLMHFHQGRVWLGGRTYTGEQRGRWYYSEIPQDVEFPQKWFSMFKTDEYFKDTAVDSGDFSQNIEVGDTDLIFFMRRSQWFLRDGDPDYEPKKIFGGKGTPFPKSVTKQADTVFFLSHDGPAATQNRTTSMLHGFAAGEVWPRLFNGQRGDFFKFEDAAEADGVFSFFFQDTWWIVMPAVRAWIGLYMPSDGQGGGAMRIYGAKGKVFPTGFLEAKAKTLLWSISGNKTCFWNFLDPNSFLDDGQPYLMRGKSKAYWVKRDTPEEMAEVFDLLFFAVWEDDSELTLSVSGEGLRFLSRASYTQIAAADSALVPDSMPNAHRMAVRQSYPEGLIARTFTVEWSKFNRAPYRFEHTGFKLRVRPIGSWSQEHESIKEAAEPRVIDAGVPADDRSAFDTIEAGEADRNAYDFEDAIDAQNNRVAVEA